MLPSKIDYTLDNPEVFRRELQREHEEIVAAIEGVRSKATERAVYPDVSPYAAKPGDVVVVTTFDLVIHLPIDVVDCDEFTVVITGDGNATILSDAGVLVGGADSDSLTFVGSLRTYKFVAGQWCFGV